MTAHDAAWAEYEHILGMCIRLTKFHFSFHLRCHFRASSALALIPSPCHMSFLPSSTLFTLHFIHPFHPKLRSFSISRRALYIFGIFDTTFHTRDYYLFIIHRQLVQYNWMPSQCWWNCRFKTCCFTFVHTFYYMVMFEAVMCVCVCQFSIFMWAWI